jgi:hypothetical protein
VPANDIRHDVSGKRFEIVVPERGEHVRDLALVWSDMTVNELIHGISLTEGWTTFAHTPPLLPAAAT